MVDPIETAAPIRERLTDDDRILIDLAAALCLKEYFPEGEEGEAITRLEAWATQRLRKLPKRGELKYQEIDEIAHDCMAVSAAFPERASRSTSKKASGVNGYHAARRGLRIRLAAFFLARAAYTVSRQREAAA